MKFDRVEGELSFGRGVWVRLAYIQGVHWSREFSLLRARRRVPLMQLMDELGIRTPGFEAGELELLRSMCF